MKNVSFYGEASKLVTMDDDDEHLESVKLGKKLINNHLQDLKELLVNE